MSTRKNEEKVHDKKNEQQPPARTPGRKLVKEDITTTSVLIRGCTVQTCCRLCPTQIG